MDKTFLLYFLLKYSKNVLKGTLDKMTILLESALFGEQAQYCDHMSEMIIEWRSYQIVYYIGSSPGFPPSIKVEKYWTLKKAHEKYHEAIGKAIRGGWSLKALRDAKGKVIFSFSYEKGTKGNYKGKG